MTADAKPALVGAATLFVVQDALAGVAHYCDVLGFKLIFLYGEPTFYAGVERDQVLIHLQAARQTKRQAGQGAVNIFVTEVDALHGELKARSAHLLNAPKDYPYGMRDFDLDDLDGNRLTFGMALREDSQAASDGADNAGSG
jgi:uncharacterized glyoxalase superfamily protein PhnB